MIKKIVPVLVQLFLIVLIILLQPGCSKNEKAEMTNEEMISRGHYLVRLGGCNDCHSPKIFTPQGPVPDTTRLLSGHPEDSVLPGFDAAMVQPGKWYLASSDLTAWVGPWGISYTANLTPDEPTGIGNWTEEIFIKALRTGLHMGTGRPILPPMPWPDIGKTSDEDLRAIFLYLKSISPIRNKVPDPVPPGQMTAAK